MDQFPIERNEGAVAATSPAVEAGGPPAEHRLDIRFVGSGSEFFRIWIVNLLLTLVTLGLYYPFAKVRRQRYFHGATEVGGHPMSYHADPWKVLRGYAVVASMTLAYGVCARLWPAAAVVVLVAFAAVWPALWHSSLRFRLANTGWRGLRLRFLGTRRGAYVAMAPGMVLGVVVAAAGLLSRPDAEDPALAGSSAALLVLLPLLVLAVAAPALLHRLRRYQHDHYALAGERTRFLVSASRFYGVTFRTGLVGLAGGLGAVLVMFAVGLVWAMSAGDAPRGSRPSALAVVVPILSMLLVYGVFFAIVRPYATCRMQNLVWNGTRSEHLRFESTLRFRPLLKLSLRNTLLVVCTLGLYLPFALVAAAQLRLQAVTVWSSVPPESLVAAAGPQEASVLGDAAGDLVGIDLGL